MCWGMKEAGVSKTDNVNDRVAASAEENRRQASERHNGTLYLVIVCETNPLTADCGDL